MLWQRRMPEPERRRLLLHGQRRPVNVRRRPMSDDGLDGVGDGDVDADADGRRYRNYYWLPATTLATDSYRRASCSSRGLS